MNKEEIYDCLNSLRIPYEVTEHKAVYTMAELVDVVFPYPESLAKNLFVRDDKKHNYYLIMVKGNKRINLKEFRRNNGTRPLSFADESDLMSVLALAPGSVTPLGLLNDKDCKAQLYLDEEFLNASEIIGIHPNDNTATVWLHTKDLIRLLREQGHNVHIIKI